MTDLTPSRLGGDLIQAERAAFANGDPLAAARDVGDEVVLTTLGQGTITLLGVQRAALPLADFDLI